jgi:hypothetical protein
MTSETTHATHDPKHPPPAHATADPKQPGDKPTDPKKAAADGTTPTDTPPTPKTLADITSTLLDSEDAIKTAMDAAVRMIGQLPATEQAKLFAAMDDEDARNGLRERHSAALKARMGIVQQEDAEKAAKDAADKAAKDSPDKAAAPEEKARPKSPSHGGY